MDRVVIPELLDTDSGTPSEVAESLSDLQWFNRWFGGITTTQAMVDEVTTRSGTNALSLLEVAAGAGYVPKTVQATCRTRGIPTEIVLLDRAPSHVIHGAENGTSVVAGDALALPFADGSFDVVSSCLFVHHLSPREVTRFVVEGLRVCRVAFLINDLIRSPLHLAWAYAGLPLYRSRITRHDAPASVKQSYTVVEMLAMVNKAGAARVDIRRHFLYRMGVIAWKG